jgi:acetyl esterase/lipase
MADGPGVREAGTNKQRRSAVPYGYAVAVLIVTWLTAWAIAPHRPRAPRPVAPSFWFSVAVNELPFLAMAWLIVITLTTAIDGSLDSPGAYAVVGVAALTGVGLAVIARRGWNAGADVRRALHDQGIAPPDQIRGGAGRPSLVRLIAWPFSVRPRGVRRARDIDYGEHSPATRLDLYLPRPGTDPAPILVYFHGGGFYSGSKSWGAKPLLYRLAASGWMCANADYRLAPRTSYAGALADARRALEWVRQHAAEYGADPERVFLAGASAGAHLASVIALGGRDSTTTAWSTPDVRGVVTLYGYYGRVRDQGGPSSPFDLIGPQAPPFLVVHGGNDSLVPVGTARDFARRLASASAGPAVFVELGGAEHSFGLFDSLRFRAVIDGIEAFLRTVDHDARTNTEPTTDGRRGASETRAPAGRQDRPREERASLPSQTPGVQPPSPPRGIRISLRRRNHGVNGEL